MDSEQTSLSFEEFLGILRRRAPLILLCVVLLAGASYGYAKHKTRMYTATAELAFNNSQIDQQIAGLSTNSGLTPLVQQQSNLELVKVGNMAVETADLLGHGLTPEKVGASVSVAGQGESSIVDVLASSSSPILAAAIANTYAGQFVKKQQSTNRGFFKSALALVNRQLASLSPAQRYGADGLDLEDRAHTLSLLAGLDYNNVELAQEALVPSSPSSPKVSKDTALGAVLGLLLGLVVAFLLERFDRRIRKPEDLETIYGLPMLGVVPKSAALSGSSRRARGNKGAALAPADAEAFSLIRAHLRFFNIDRELRALVIASPAPGDGKSTVARHLAEAAARSGSRVLLLEVDLRHPTLAQQLAIQPGPGLAGALIGTIATEQAIQSVSSEVTVGATGGHKLDVLMAGSVLPPNPGELLESRAMDSLLEWAKSRYDLVVIDTPPLTAVSDPFPLLTKVDGVVLVGRVGHSRRDAAEGLQQILAGSGAPLLGVIANGAKSSSLGSYAAPAGGASSAGVITSANGSSSSSSSSSEELTPTA
jgi:succinoglycan biosynthesis transport protein ExoP